MILHTSLPFKNGQIRELVWGQSSYWAQCLGVAGRWRSSRCSRKIYTTGRNTFARTWSRNKWHVPRDNILALKRLGRIGQPADQGLSRYLETGCPNRGFIDFCVSKVWYKIHTTNKIDPIPLQILLFLSQILLCVSYKSDTTASTSSIL